MKYGQLTHLANMKYQFRQFVLDLERGCLWAGDQEVDLRPKCFKLLHLLVENHGRALSKEEIATHLWPRTTVSDESLARCVSDVRAAIKDADKSLIKTVSGRGYLFAAPVRVQSVHPSSIAGSEEHEALPAIAILPFRNLSVGSRRNYFADGIVEDIIGALGRMRSLLVISRNSTFAYRNSTKSARQIGEELGVRYLVTGSIRRHTGQIRVVANLLEAETGLNIWSESYDRKLGEVFAVQDDITRSLAAALEPSIRNAEIKRAQKKPTESLQAYDLYLRALLHVHATTEKDNALALSLLRTALGIDPRFARAAAMAAMRFEYRSVQGWGGPLTREELAEAITLAENAVQLEPEDPVVLWAAAIIAGRFGQDHKRAADFIERSLMLNPNSVEALAFGGWAKCHAGEFSAAAKLFEKALRLSPLDPSRFRSSLGLAATHFAASRYDDAIAWCQRSIAEYPHFSPTYRFLAASAAHLGHYRIARDAVAELLRIDPGFSIATFLGPGNPYRDGEFVKRYVLGLQKAGAPL